MRRAVFAALFAWAYAGAASAQLPSAVEQPSQYQQDALAAHARGVIEAADAGEFFVVETTDLGGVSVRHPRSGLRCGAEGLVSITVARPDVRGIALGDNVRCLSRRDGVSITFQALPRSSASVLSREEHVETLQQAVVERLRGARDVDVTRLDTAIRPEAFPNRHSAALKVEGPDPLFFRFAVADIGDWRYMMIFNTRTAESDQQNFMLSDITLLGMLSGTVGARAELEAAGLPIPAQ